MTAALLAMLALACTPVDMRVYDDPTAKRITVCSGSGAEFRRLPQDDRAWLLEGTFFPDHPTFVPAGDPAPAGVLTPLP